MKYHLFLFIKENTFQFIEHKWSTDGTLSENWVMGQSMSLASLHCGVWLVYQWAMMTYRRTWTSKRNGLTRSSWRSTTRSAKFCTWGGKTLCTSICWSHIDGKQFCRKGLAKGKGQWAQTEIQNVPSEYHKTLCLLCRWLSRWMGCPESLPLEIFKIYLDVGLSNHL